MMLNEPLVHINLFLSYSILLGLNSCTFFAPDSKTSKGPPPGSVATAYSCDLGSLSDANAELGTRGMRKFYLSWLSQPLKDAPEGQAVLISDDSFLEKESAVILILDRERKVVDQIRDRNGQPATFDLNAKYVTEEQGRAQMHIRLGTLLLDAAPRALTNNNSTNSQSKQNSNLTDSKAVAFSFESHLFKLDRDDTLPPILNYGPLPRAIYRDNSVACSFEGYL